LKRIREEKGKKVKKEALCGPLREFPPLIKRLRKEAQSNYA
jgi:hypothetical protein